MTEKSFPVEIMLDDKGALILNTKGDDTMFGFGASRMTIPPETLDYWAAKSKKIREP